MSCFTRGVLCKAGLLDNSKFGLDCSGLGWGWRWGWLWLHGDWRPFSGQAVWGLDTTGVGGQCPCVAGRSWSAPGTGKETGLIIDMHCSTDTENVSLK